MEKSRMVKIDTLVDTVRLFGPKYWSWSIKSPIIMTQKFWRCATMLLKSRGPFVFILFNAIHWKLIVHLTESILATVGQLWPRLYCWSWTEVIAGSEMAHHSHDGLQLSMLILFSLLFQIDVERGKHREHCRSHLQNANITVRVCVCAGKLIELILLHAKYAHFNIKTLAVLISLLVILYPTALSRWPFCSGSRSAFLPCCLSLFHSLSQPSFSLRIICVK